MADADEGINLPDPIGPDRYGRTRSPIFDRLVGQIDPRSGIFRDEDVEGSLEDASLFADIFLYHLHYLHKFSFCPVCEDGEESHTTTDSTN